MRVGAVTLRGAAWMRRASVLVLAGVLLALVAGNAAASVRIVRRVHLSGTPGGVAVLGSRWAFVGSQFSSDAMSVFRIPRLGVAARWRMPSLGDGLDWTMERAVVTPDDRWLLVLNQVRREVAVVDVTGAVPVRSIHLGSDTAWGLVPSPDGKSLAVVSPGAPTELFDLASGQEVGQISGGAGGPSAVAFGRDGRLFALFIDDHSATVEAFNASGSGQVLASFRGNILAKQSGAIAVSPDERRVYVLYDGLRAFDASSGRRLGLVRLPTVPGYIDMAVAPNGRQAMLWAPQFAEFSDTPAEQPGYVINHFGYYPGGVVAVNLRRMRPIRANLHSIGSPWQVTYTSNSRYAVVSEQNHRVDLLATGTAGPDRAPYPHVSLRQPTGGSGGVGSGGTGGSSGSGGTGGSGGSGSGGSGSTACTSWNVAGTWTWEPSVESGGPNSGPASLQQSGSSISGTVTDGTNGQVWTISGTISGANVQFSMQPPPSSNIVPVTDGQGTVNSDGTEIVGSTEGSFTGGHATCTG